MFNINKSSTAAKQIKKTKVKNYNSVFTNSRNSNSMITNENQLQVQPCASKKSIIVARVSEVLKDITNQKQFSSLNKKTNHAFMGKKSSITDMIIPLEKENYQQSDSFADAIIKRYITNQPTQTKKKETFTTDQVLTQRRYQTKIKQSKTKPEVSLNQSQVKQDIITDKLPTNLMKIVPIQSLRPKNKKSDYSSLAYSSYHSQRSQSKNNSKGSVVIKSKLIEEENYQACYQRELELILKKTRNKLGEYKNKVQKLKFIIKEQQQTIQDLQDENNHLKKLI